MDVSQKWLPSRQDCLTLGGGGGGGGGGKAAGVRGVHKGRCGEGDGGLIENIRKSDKRPLEVKIG